MPPYLRVVDVSAWVKGWKSLPTCSGGHADAGVAHREVQLDLLAGPLEQLRRSTTDLALLGELDRVVDEVDEDLAEPQRVAHQVARACSGATCAQELQPLVVRLLADERRPRCSMTSSSWKSVASMSSLPASILEKSRMSLMIAEQRRAGAVDLARRSRAASASSSVLQRQVRHADDGVHRRADLVAHVGEEHRTSSGWLPRPSAWPPTSSVSSSLKSVMSWVTPNMSVGLPLASFTTCPRA